MPDTDADNEADSPGWVPDQRTIDWCFGALYYKNLIAPLRDTARGRYEAGEDRLRLERRRPRFLGDRWRKR